MRLRVLLLMASALLVAAWLLAPWGDHAHEPPLADDPDAARDEHAMRGAEGLGPGLEVHRRKSRGPGSAKPSSTPPRGGQPEHVVLRGTVEDALTYAPIQGVRVFEMSYMVDAERQTIAEVERETLTDARGRFELRTTATPLARWRLLYYAKDGYAGRRDAIRIRRSRAAEAAGPTVRLPRLVTLRGRVVDERGHPMAGAQITYSGVNDAGRPTPKAMRCDDDGAFQIPRYPLIKPAERHHFKPRLEAYHPEALEHATSNDVHAMTPRMRNDIVIPMKTGTLLAGIVEDEKGQPLPNALVEIWADSADRRGARSDAAGRFELRSVKAGRTQVRVVHFGRWLHAAAPVRVDRDAYDLELEATSIPTRLPAAREVLGMQLVTATPALRKALFFPPRVRVLVVDPGERIGAVGLPRLEAGDGITHVAGMDCGSVGEFVRHAQEHLALSKGRRMASVPIACEFAHPDFRGSHATKLRLEAEDIEALSRAGPLGR